MLSQELRRCYLDLLKKAVAGRLSPSLEAGPMTETELARAAVALDRARVRVHDRGEIVGQMLAATPEAVVGWMRSHPLEALTLTDPAGIDNLEFCVLDLLRRGVPGDLMECGVWRGGLTIFMRGLLRAFGVTGRRVWVADSFEGLPCPDAELSPVDAVAHEFLALIDGLRADQADVRASFERFDLLDDQVRFLPGWFEHSLPTAAIESLALLRLDADYYESTRTILDHLYTKVSPGGFVIVDDYRIANFGAGRAVDEFRHTHGIEEPLQEVNAQAVFWRKSSR